MEIRLILMAYLANFSINLVLIHGYSDIFMGRYKRLIRFCL